MTRTKKPRRLWACGAGGERKAQWKCSATLYVLQQQAGSGSGLGLGQSSGLAGLSSVGAGAFTAGPVNTMGPMSQSCIGVGVHGVGREGAAAKVHSLVGAANVLQRVIQHSVQGVKLRLLLLLGLRLVDGLRDGDFVVTLAAVRPLIGTQLDDGGAGFAQFAAQRFLIVRRDQGAGLVAIGGDVLGDFVAVFHDRAIHASELLGQDHAHGVDGFLDAIGAGGQAARHVVQLAHDASGLGGLARFHGGGAHCNRFVNLTDSGHEAHVGLVLFGAVAVEVVALAMAVAVDGVVVVHEAQQQAFGDFSHIGLSKNPRKSRCIHWKPCARSKQYDSRMSYHWLSKPTEGTKVIESRLTPRQKDVFKAVCQGKSNKQIARELDMAEATVKLHLTSVFKALGVQTRTQAALLATDIPPGLARAAPDGLGHLGGIRHHGAHHTRRHHARPRCCVWPGD